MRLRELKTEHMTEPLGLWTSEPRFSWQLDGASASPASAYEIEVSDEGSGATAWRSGPTSHSGIALVAYGGDALRSAARYAWRVRVQIDGSWTPWAASWFETSLLHRSEWTAAFIEPEQEPITPDGLRRANGDWAPPLHEGPIEGRLHPVQYVRQSFDVPRAPRRARLFATAHGVYDAEINGRPVGDQVFAPGYESYDTSLSFQTYDVTASIAAGENVLSIRIADGWFGGRIDFTGSSAQYGDRLSAGWQLHIEDSEGSYVVVPSADARSSDAGPIRYADIFIGERHDARREFPGWSSPGFDASAWKPVALRHAPAVLVPFVGEPVRRTEEIAAVEVLRTPAGEDVVDFGQVIAGRVRMRIQGPAGTEVTLEHSETLDRDGNFFPNIGGVNKDQTDSYVVAGRPEGEIWEPSFTFHGFRYAKITGYPGRVRAEDFAAVVIGSDLEVTGGFACSDESLTRLHENIVWSQRANFLAIPTDCPQRERVGWTGDLQVFAPSAVRNRDVQLFIQRWLGNVRRDQHPDGLVPVIVPAPPYMSSLSEELAEDPLLSIRAAAGWGDAIVLVPWALYRSCGDTRVLGENYDAMRAWVERQIAVAETEVPKRLRGRDLRPDERARQRLLWNSEPNFGDWNAPSVKVADPSLEHMLAVAETTGEIIAAMFHHRSLDVLSSVAAVLGRDDDARAYRHRAAAVKHAFAEEYLDGAGGLWSPSQGTYVLALAFGLVPADQRDQAVQNLVVLVHAAGDHLDTGFLSVPHLLDVLWDNGHRELARRILWQRSAPSWLYAIDRGATTVWEEWAAISEEGEVGFASLNHYAFGCVDDWLYRRIVGIEPLEPGYRTVRIEPDLDVDLEWADGWQKTPWGTVQVSWKRHSGESRGVRLDIRLPPGVEGELHLPGRGEVHRLSSGETTFHTETTEVLS